ncbi:acyltransferase [Synechococcus sp. AH-736-G20]|nr:acyltransferase [Synechococcus sp. AH-736-G20]
MTISNHSKKSYRPEIDGIRAFAVIVVIINHFNSDLLPSGYLGVDIFFVISGYVITSSLFGRVSTGIFDFVGSFYERRIRRLVPALLLFVLSNTLLFSFFNPNTSTAVRTGWRSLIGISNIFLFTSANDYFAPSTALNPFTHTWSLSVEEQFYFLFPFIVYFSGFTRKFPKGVRNLALLLLPLTVASLIVFLFFHQINQPAAYYLMPSRFWEMAVGSLIFLTYLNTSITSSLSYRIPSSFLLIAIIGILFLPVTAAAPATILIVLLTCFLLLCLRDGTTLYQLLCIHNVSYIGKISYSLYLWHWSILCISRWTIGIHWWTIPFQLVIIFLIASASYRFIETPFRKGFDLNRYIVFLVGALSITLSLVFVKSSATFLKFAYLGNRNTSFLSSYGDVGWQESNVPKRPGSTQQILIIGNSHAKQLLPLAKYLSKNNPLSYRIIGTAIKAIPSISGTYLSVNNLSDFKSSSKYLPPEMLDVHQESGLSVGVDPEVKQAIKELDSGDILVLSSRLWSLYVHPFDLNGEISVKYSRDDSGQLLDNNSIGIFWQAKMYKLLQLASLKGVNVVFISPYPEFSQHLQLAELCTREWFRPILSGGCYVSELRSSLLTKRFIPQFEIILSQLEDQFRGFHIFNAFDVLCPPSKLYCDSSDATGRLYFDNDHLNVRGVLSLSSVFNEFLHARSLLSLKP